MRTLSSLYRGFLAGLHTVMTVGSMLLLAVLLLWLAAFLDSIVLSTAAPEISRSETSEVIEWPIQARPLMPYDQAVREGYVHKCSELLGSDTEGRTCVEDGGS